MVDVPLQTWQLEIIVDLLKEYELTGREYLEVGCGEGMSTEVFSKIGMKGAAFDTSDEAIKIIRDKKLSNTRVFHSDFLECKKKTDLIFMLNFIEHVENPLDFINNSFRLLNNDGHLILAVPINPKAYGAADRNAGHYQRLDKKKLVDELKTAGFEIKEVIHMGFPVCDIYTLIFNIVYKNTKFECNNRLSGIRCCHGYYPHKLEKIIPLLFPVLTYLIRVDVLFRKTSLGNNIIILCKKNSVVKG